MSSAKDTIGKLKIIAEMSQAAETKQLCNVMIEYVESRDRDSMELGFSAPSAKNAESPS